MFVVGVLPWIFFHSDEPKLANEVLTSVVVLTLLAAILEPIWNWFNRPDNDDPLNIREKLK